MFCYQCEQTAKGPGCTAFGVCGKSPEVADLQDLLLYVTQGVSQYAHRARALGAIDKDVDVFVTDVIMPGMDGPSWVREALKDRPGTRVVFVSGYSEDRKKAIASIKKQITQY